MKIKTVLAAAVIASTSTMSFAGNTISPADNVEIFIPEATAPASSSGGKYLIPIIACLVICSALASSGSSGGS